MNHARIEPRVEHLPQLDGYTVEFAAPGDFLLSRREHLYHSRDLQPPFRRVTSVKAPWWRRTVAQARLGQRLLRFLVTNVVPLGGGELFVTFDKSVGVVRSGRYAPLPGLQRPCRVLRGACAVDSAGDVYFGEYLANTARDEINLYRYRRAHSRLEVAHTFSRGAVRHVHGIYRDPDSDFLYCLTGDQGAECRIMRSRDGFATLESVGAGDESWRSVSMVFTKEALLYGTDAEYRENRIYSLTRSTGQRHELGTVGGTMFYSQRLGHHAIFTQTAEGAPSQAECVAAIWWVEPNAAPRELVRFAKDRWHNKLFMYGIIHLPGINRFTDRSYFHLLGLTGDNQTFVLELPAEIAS